MKTKLINIKRLMIGLALILVAAILYMPLATVADLTNNSNPVYEYNWQGHGTDSLDGSKAGEGGRPDDGSGWIHWVFSTKGDSTEATLVLSGSGSGNYQPGEPLNAQTWHFFTPYFELEQLNAVIILEGGDKGPGVGLVISDYWPGSEEEEPGDPDEPDEPEEPGNPDEPELEEVTLIIEKVLLDQQDNPVFDSNVQFTVLIDGGQFANEAISFSVTEPAMLSAEDGLEKDVLYTVSEVELEDYTQISITPDQSFTLTDESYEITITVTNREPETPFSPPPVPPTPPTPPVVFLTPPEEPETEPEEEPQEPVVEIPALDEPQELAVDAEEPAVEPEELVILEPEDPQIEPEEEVLVLSPEAPQQTPQTDGVNPSPAWLGIIMLGGGILIRFGKIV